MGCEGSYKKGEDDIVELYERERGVPEAAERREVLRREKRRKRYG